jgi:ABC-type branched-subunit amino acid transport system substrate-binding protein
MGKKAQELGVPLVALTQKEAVGGDYVFNAALTPAMQVRELVRFATEKAGAKRFAVLSPTSKFGEEYANAFWDEVDRVGGSIRGYETYPENETDFRAYIDKIVGLAQTDARAHEVEELKLLKAATPVKTHSKKFDRMFDLKPIVDFDAVFIPDEPKVLGQILPTFAYRDVEKVLFLGINTWNSQELLARAGQFAEGSVFVDGYYAGAESPSSKKFMEEYRETYGSEPSLVEALAYDAANIVASLIRDGGAGSRSSLRDKIIGLRDFPGVAGKISYQEGRLTKRLQFLTVKNGRIEEVAFH